MKVDWSIKIGDVLTMTTIIVSVIALLISWSKDRHASEKEQADRVRVSVSVAVAKLDRMQALQLSAFNELQPVFVDAAEMLVNDFNVVAARDFLWKSTNLERTKITAKILDEQIESAYIGLFAHFPDIRPLFLDTLAKMKDAEEEALGAFLAAAELDVQAVRQSKADYRSTELQKALRSSASKQRTRLKRDTDNILEPVRAFLLQVVTKSDSEILTPGLAMATTRP